MLLGVLCFSIHASAQLLARMEVKEPIPGICDEKEVYALFPGFTGQVEAVGPLTEEQIRARLTEQVQYVKDHPKYKGKGMVSVIVNCKNEAVQCKTDNTTGETELDEQIVAVFRALGPWKSGQLNGKPVDSVLLYSFKIKGGKFMEQ